MVCNLHLFLSEVRRCGADLVYLHTSLSAYCEFAMYSDRKNPSHSTLHT